MMPLQQNEADASRMDKGMLVTSRVMNWEDEEAGDTRTTILLRSAMDEDMLVTSRMMTRRASGLGRRGGQGYAAGEMSGIELLGN